MPPPAPPVQMSELAPPGGAPSQVKGKYGVAQLPGSEVVYDRDMMSLQPCTAELCPCGLDSRTEQVLLQQVRRDPTGGCR